MKLTPEKHAAWVSRQEVAPAVGSICGRAYCDRPECVHPSSRIAGNPEWAAMMDYEATVDRNTRDALETIEYLYTTGDPMTTHAYDTLIAALSPSAGRCRCQCYGCLAADHQS